MFPNVLRAAIGRSNKVAAGKASRVLRRPVSQRPAGKALGRNSVELTSQHRRQLVCDVLAAGGHMWVRGGGWSMHPTIKPGERVLLEPLRRELRRGDIVAF